MRKWLCLGAIVILSGPTLACGSEADQASQEDQDQAKAVAQSFFEEIGNKEYGRACDLSTIPGGGCEGLLRAFGANNRLDSPKATGENTSVTISGDTGAVQVGSYIAYVQNVRGDWKVTWPAFAPKSG